MQGFIIFIQPVRDEDLWVHIVTENELLRLYRFYGARHSVISIGHKIDFCVQNEGTKHIARLKEVLQLGFIWERDRNKRSLWQSFMQLLYHHLKETHTIDPFYFNLLEEATIKLERQNAMRSLCEAYTKLLHFEGRANELETCFVCNAVLEDQCTLVRSFLGICPRCLLESGVTSFKYCDRKKIAHFIRHSDAMFLEDLEVTYLWKIMLMGL